MKKKKSLFSRLLDSKDLTVNATTWYMLVSLALSALLYLTIIIVLLIEIGFNHTISTDLNGIAALLGVASSPGVSGGVVKGWSVYTHAKHDRVDYSEDSINNLNEEEL